MIDYQTDMQFTGKQILVFSTDWCPDCIMLNMYIDQVISENPDWEFIYINSDIHPQLASDYNILGIPSFVALVDSQVASTLISKQAKPKELINEWIVSINE